MKFPQRKPDSHKGENGKVLIIGGSEMFHGAPILTGLGAEAAGADLIFLVIPSEHVIPAKVASENFIIQQFEKSHFSLKDVDKLSDFANNMCDSFVIGNGLGKNSEIFKAVMYFLSKVKIPGVVDADALIPEILKIEHNFDWIIIPHDGEFKRLFNTKATKENVKKFAKKYNLTILKKGEIDLIASNDQFTENKTGVSEMAVGGTGDCLAGIIGSLVSKGIQSFEAAKIAAFYWGKTGEYLAQKKISFTAREMCKKFPKVVIDLQ